MEKEKILEVINVNKLYRNKPVLHDINLFLVKGEILGLVGESGCGKTTLSRCITGLITDYTGEITFNGHPIKQKNLKQIRQNTAHIQMVFQDPYSSLNPKKTIGWILEEGLRVRKQGTSDDRKKRVIEILELVALPIDVISRYPHELSGGQRQRVSIGCSLMLNPEIIIADEPISSLDVSIQAQILNLLIKINKELGISIIFISHDLNVVYYLCDRIAVMNGGKIIECNIADKIYNNPQHHYTKSLLDSILI